ncbi:MAG: putative quinol monooxygenase [Chitinophagia bacterium]
MYRIAKIRIDSNHMQAYHQALQEQMQAAIQKESGVLSYTALANKNNPTEITIIEVYANMDAYQAHIQTPHFKKYKQIVNGWVLSLELLDQTLIATAKQSSF